MKLNAPPMLEDMALFVEVVDAGGLTAASKRLGLRKSTLSRRLSALEETLGARLLERTPRQFRLTEAGKDYYQRAAPLVAQARELHQAFTDARDTPRGTLRLTTTHVLGETLLPPLLPTYLARCPQVEVEVHLSQARVDLVAEGYDLAIRTGALEDSSLITRRLGMARTGYFASPGYLRRHGVPGAPQELASHSCVLMAHMSRQEQWTFSSAEGTVAMAVSGRLRVASLRMGLAALCAGVGIGRLPAFLVTEELRTGQLTPVLEDWTPPSTPIHALYPSQRQLAPRVQVFLELLYARLGQAPWAPELPPTVVKLSPPRPRPLRRSAQGDS